MPRRSRLRLPPLPRMLWLGRPPRRNRLKPWATPAAEAAPAAEEKPAEAPAEESRSGRPRRLRLRPKRARLRRLTKGSLPKRNRPRPRMLPRRPRLRLRLLPRRPRLRRQPPRTLRCQ